MILKFDKNISQIDAVQWQQLIESSSTVSFFQTKECYDFYKSLSFMEPFVFGVSENNKLTGLICGYIIAEGNPLKQFFSRRAIVPGGALLDDNISAEALEMLLKNTQRELSRKVIYIEFRNYNNYSHFRTQFESQGFQYNAHLNFHVATPDVESALKNMSTTKRRDIKLMRREEAYWEEITSPEDIKIYYSILEDLYKTRIKTPLFPIEFFEKIAFSTFGKILAVKYNGAVIGGSTCVMLKGKIIYEWFVCGLDGKMKNIFPSTMATWAAMEYAASNGYSRFDMMGAGKPDEGYGVREFKSKFGGELVEHGRFLYLCKPRLYALGKYVVKKMKSGK